MKKTSLIFILILPLFLGALTIDEAVNLALENNKELQMAKEDVTIANREYRNVKGSLLPQVSGQVGVFNSHTNLPDKADVTIPKIASMLDSTANANEQVIAGVTDNFIQESLPELEQDKTQYGATVKVDQVIYLGGKLLAGIEAAKKYENLTKNQFLVKKNEVVFQTKKLYYSVILAQEALKINQEAYQTAQKHLEQVTSMRENGIVSEYDFLRAQLEVSKLRPKVVESENNLALAKEAFAKQIGISAEDINIEGKIEFEKKHILGLDESIKHAIEHRPEIKLVNLTKDMYRLQYKAEKGNFLPNIVFQGELTHYAEGDDQFSLKDDDFGTSYKYGIGIELPLFKGFSNKAKKEKAYAQYRKSKVQEADIRELITLDVRNSFLSYKNALENLDVQSENTLLANKGLEIAEVRFANNIGIQLEVFDAQLQVNIAKLNLLNAKFNALISYEQYEKSIGNYK